MHTYLANKNTKEIHKLSNVKPECKISLIAQAHKLYLDSEAQVNNLIANQGYDGCAYCYREKHTK